MTLSFGLSCDLRQNNQSGRLTLTANMCAVCDDAAKNPISMNVVKLEEQHGRSHLWAQFRSCFSPVSCLKHGPFRDNSVLPNTHGTSLSLQTEPGLDCSLGSSRHRITTCTYSLEPFHSTVHSQYHCYLNDTEIYSAFLFLDNSFNHNQTSTLRSNFC